MKLWWWNEDYSENSRRTICLSEMFSVNPGTWAALENKNWLKIKVRRFTI